MNAATATLITPPALGAAWPGLEGYIYAGLMRGELGQEDYHLAVLTGPAAVALTGGWGEYGQPVANADHKRNGLANTAAMAEAGSKLAQQVLDAGAYIASQCEADLVRANAREHMAPGWHWTSTQDSPYNAWVQDFEYGFSYLYYKNGEFRAVAVRRFNSSTLDPSKAQADEVAA